MDYAESFAADIKAKDGSRTLDEPMMEMPATAAAPKEPEQPLPNAQLADIVLPPAPPRNHAGSAVT